MTTKKLDPSGLGRVWDRAFSLVKLLTGDVDVKGKGTLQDQIDLLNENLGNIKDGIQGTVNVKSSAVDITNICAVWLEPGIYYASITSTYTLPNQAQVETHLYNNTTGEYALLSMIQTLPAGYQILRNAGIFKVSEKSCHMIMRSRQNSGATLECRGTMHITRLK